MTYEPTHWQDRIVEKPRTYHVQNNPDGTITLIPAPGTVVQEGTPVNAANLNKLETQYDTVKAELGNNTGELWAQIKAADGAGSGLDADTVDGIHAAAFNKVLHIFSGYIEELYGGGVTEGQIYPITIPIGKSGSTKCILFISNRLRNDSGAGLYITTSQSNFYGWPMAVFATTSGRGMRRFGYFTSDQTDYNQMQELGGDFRIKQAYISGSNIMLQLVGTANVGGPSRYWLQMDFLGICLD